MELTLGQWIDNIEKNGYPQLVGKLWWQTWKDNKRVFDIEKGACALGQGYYNTFHDYDDTANFWRYKENLEFVPFPEDFKYPPNYENHFSAQVVYLNDILTKSIPEIASIMRELYKDQLDKVIWEWN